MQKNTVLIFDLDGTLWGSTAEAIAATLDELARLGAVITPALEMNLRIQWGSHFTPLRDQYFPMVTDKALVELYARVNARVDNAPYDGAAETLWFLKDRGLDMYALTSRGRCGAMRRLTRFGMADLFTRLICSSDIGRDNVKPSAFGLDLILLPLEKALGLRREDVVYVGDTVTADRLCAANAGVKFVVMNVEKIVDRVVWLDAGMSDENILGSVPELLPWLGIAA